MGATSVCFSTVPTVGATQQSETNTVLEKSIQLRVRNGWSHQRWQSYLEEQGWEMNGVNRTFTIDLDDNSDVKNDKLSELKFTMIMKYAQSFRHDHIVIWLEWNHETGFFQGGEYPSDNASISYDSSHYSPSTELDKWVVYSPYVADPDGIDSKTPSGAVSEFNDVAVREGYFGVRLDPNENYSPSDRNLYFDYVHTWSGAGLAGVSIGTGGISMQFGQKTDRWDLQDVHNERQLRNGDETESG